MSIKQSGKVIWKGTTNTPQASNFSGMIGHDVENHKYYISNGTSWNPFSLWKNTTGSTLVRPDGSSLDLSSQYLRKRILRPYFETYKASMMSLYPPTGNTGSVIYVDPTAGVDGSGTFASPRNVMPTIVDNTTYLLKENTRIVVASAIWTGITATGVIIGTYSALNGSRVYQPERLATVDGSTFFRAAIRWQGTTGNFTLSGLRIVGATNASGGVNLFESITAPATSVITIEYCIFEAMGSYQLVSSQINNAAIAIAGPKTIVRFNRICVEGDGISLSPASGAGYEIVCNDITTPKNITVGGPDCIQILRTSTNPVGQQVIIGNWLNQAANTKQAFILTGGTPQSSGEEMLFTRNFLFGVDCATNPVLPPFSSGQIAYINDSTSRTILVGNYFDQFIGWASIPSNSILANNIGILEHTSSDWLVGFSTASGASNSLLLNNTVIGLNSIWISGDTNKGFESNGSNEFVNNICVNLGMRLGGGATETYTIFSGSSPTNLSNTVLSLGTGSSYITDSKLDSVGRPIQDSPALSNGIIKQFNSTIARFSDIFGQTQWETTPNIGAAQGWRDS